LACPAAAAFSVSYSKQEASWHDVVIVVQVAFDQLTYGPFNNLMNMTFFTLLVESAPLNSFDQ
jgi:hypothetical protein